MPNPRPGDVILIHGTNWLARFIRLGERIHFRAKQDRPFAYWSHAALSGHHLAGSPDRGGDTGLIVSHIDKYRDQEYHYVHLDLSRSERSKTVSFAYSCVRQKYGLAGFLPLTLSVLVGDRFKVPDRGQQGCVALIVRALQHPGVTFEQRPSDMMPSDLAKRFGVTP